MSFEISEQLADYFVEARDGLVVADVVFRVRFAGIIILVGLVFAAFFLIHDGSRDEAVWVAL